MENMSSLAASLSEDLEDDRGLSDDQLKAICEPILRGEQASRELILRVRDSDYWRPRFCFIHAVRYCREYVALPEVVSLCTELQDPSDAVFARTYYARLIMNDIVPDMDTAKPETLPYCIWYPDVASEQTYREVAGRYPQLRYQVARACAVAGYDTLYQELDVLPEVAVAEEARTSFTGEQSKIFQLIMKSPVRYRVMDDYEKRIIPNPQHGFLNADTATVAELKTVIPYWAVTWYLGDPMVFDVLEDRRLGLEAVEDDRDTSFGREHQSLLYMPLLGDLPAMPDKNMLVVMAAYHGNVDRYVRLRRPRMVPGELDCCIRGIYHSTPFARWWFEQDDVTVPIIEACHARFTMMNDLSWLPSRTLPYLIWWPVMPHLATLEALVRKEPKMAQAVGHACVFGDYRDLYDRIKPEPTSEIRREARCIREKYYLEDLQARREQLPAGWREIDFPPGMDVQVSPTYLTERTEPVLFGRLEASIVLGSYPGAGLYAGSDPNGGYVDLFMCASQELIKKAEDEDGIMLPEEEDE